MARPTIADPGKPGPSVSSGDRALSVDLEQCLSSRPAIMSTTTSQAVRGRWLRRRRRVTPGGHACLTHPAETRRPRTSATWTGRVTTIDNVRCWMSKTGSLLDHPCVADTGERSSLLTTIRNGQAALAASSVTVVSRESVDVSDGHSCGHQGNLCHNLGLRVEDTGWAPADAGLIACASDVC